MNKEEQIKKELREIDAKFYAMKLSILNLIAMSGPEAVTKIYHLEKDLQKIRVSIGD